MTTTAIQKTRLTDEQIIGRLRQKLSSRQRESFDYLVDYARNNDAGSFLRRTLRLLRRLSNGHASQLRYAAEAVRALTPDEARARMDFTSFAFKYCDDCGYGYATPYAMACRQTFCVYFNQFDEDAEHFPVWLQIIALRMFYCEYTVDDYDGWHHLAI